MVIASLFLALNVATYQSQHRDVIYSGVSMMGVDLSQMTPEEAKTALTEALPFAKADDHLYRSEYRSNLVQIGQRVGRHGGCGPHGG
ncbi:hypothetical protein [Candidatus Amarobacter glycogenicus]|uniref:hypothetical protein n=1 Tax=Candidatus Amarobacter glycogenicus TaxID=3140699 RepID=UPI002A12C1D4|nr:hypothetical protein [Dehalococcoidia bacterium]